MFSNQNFTQSGFIFPVSVLNESEVANYHDKLETFEVSQGGKLEPSQRSKSHLLFKWLDDLIRDPRILDTIELLIGPNILCWNTIFWIKEANSHSFVSWHQDKRYWGLSNDKVVTSWITLSNANQKSG